MTVQDLQTKLFELDIPICKVSYFTKIRQHHRALSITVMRFPAGFDTYLGLGRCIL